MSSEYENMIELLASHTALERSLKLKTLLLSDTNVFFSSLYHLILQKPCPKIYTVLPSDDLLVFQVFPFIMQSKPDL